MVGKIVFLPNGDHSSESPRSALPVTQFIRAPDCGPVSYFGYGKYDMKYSVLATGVDKHGNAMLEGPHFGLRKLRDALGESKCELSFKQP